MKNFRMTVALFFLSFFVIGCESSQKILWNPGSEMGKEVDIKVKKNRFLFWGSDISVRIDGDEVIKGNGGVDKKTEYSSEYKGKSVKAIMIYNSQTCDEIVELYLDGKLVGEFTFPKSL